MILSASTLQGLCCKLQLTFRVNNCTIMTIEIKSKPLKGNPPIPMNETSSSLLNLLQPSLICYSDEASFIR